MDSFSSTMASSVFSWDLQATGRRTAPISALSVLCLEFRFSFLLAKTRWLALNSAVSVHTCYVRLCRGLTVSSRAFSLEGNAKTPASCCCGLDVVCLCWLMSLNTWSPAGGRRCYGRLRTFGSWSLTWRLGVGNVGHWGQALRFS